MAIQSQGLRQVQKQTQNLVLAPQLRQSLKILQVPAWNYDPLFLRNYRPILCSRSLEPTTKVGREVAEPARTSNLILQTNSAMIRPKRKLQTMKLPQTLMTTGMNLLRI